MIDPARSFDRSPGAYEATRPSYPPEILDAVPVGPEATVLDLGAGTGKLTRVLARRYAKVIAVEPLDGMRAMLERVVPEAEALAGRAEEIPLPDAAVEAVFAGQALHWFASATALQEIARVLRPGGLFCAVWNSGDDSRPNPLPAEFRAYLRELRTEIAAFESSPFADVIALGPFAEVHQAAVAHDHVLDHAGLIENARSFSWIACRDESNREAALARLASLLPEGTYAIPNLANAMWAWRT